MTDNTDTENQTQASTKEEPTCNNCGSNDITADAAAKWDNDAQEWDLASTYDSYYCNSCGEESKQVEWKAVPDAG